MTNPGKGHLLGRDIVYQNLNTGSLLVGQGLEVKELIIGRDQQVLTVVSGSLQWQTKVLSPSATGENIGAGKHVLSNVTNGHSQYRTVTAGLGMVITETANEINFEVDLTSIASLPSSTTIGTPSDGSWTTPIFPGAAAPAFSHWTNIYPAADAFDDLNEMMGLLLPPQPDNLSVITINMSGGENTRVGANILLSSSVIDNTGTTAILPGTQIYRISNSLASTIISNVFGPGNGGTLTAIVNGIINGQIILSRGSNVGNNLSLDIITDTDFPVATPGFWEAITAKITSIIPSGVNKFVLSHDISGNSNDIIFVYDNLYITPITSAIMVIEDAGNPPYNFSSGIPHLVGGSIVNVNATVGNLSSNTYLSSGIIQIGSVDSSLGNIININPGTFGISTVLSRSELPITVSTVPFIINNTTFTTSPIRVRGRNAEINGPWLNDTFNINSLGIIPTNKIDEKSVRVTSGTVPPGAKITAERIMLPGGDNPITISVNNFLDAGWNSLVSIPAYEAAVVGGILKQDRTNYSIGNIPIGPNYSSHNTIQYATWFFRRATISNFSINITGTYSGLWVTMSGVNFGTAPNNWLDMGQLYAGAGIPGLNGSNGCAVGAITTGLSGLFTCTFGPATSSTATNNIIMVRIKLNAGEQITSLSF